MLELTETLENGVIGLALSLVGTYYFCVFNGAKSLHCCPRRDGVVLRSAESRGLESRRSGFSG